MRSKGAPALHVVRLGSAAVAAATDFLVDSELLTETRQSEAFTPLSSAPRLGEISVTDWNTLFRALKWRLQHSVADISTNGPDCMVRTSVLECVEELRHLHRTLGQERGWHVSVERELREAHAALARARSDLSDSRADDARRAKHIAGGFGVRNS